jgi:mandelamide amidase
LATHRLDAIVTSTVSVQPPRIGEDNSFVVDGVSLPTFATIVRNASLATVVGSPSLSIPAGFDEDGLPVGLQIDGPVGNDRFVLAIGAILESILSDGRIASGGALEIPA